MVIKPNRGARQSAFGRPRPRDYRSNVARDGRLGCDRSAAQRSDLDAGAGAERVGHGGGARARFAAAELFARTEALLRRSEQTNRVILRTGPLELNRIERRAKRGSPKIDLAPRQFRLLEYMMQRADQLLTRGTLLKEVWGYKFVPNHKEHFNGDGAVSSYLNNVRTTNETDRCPDRQQYRRRR